MAVFTSNTYDGRYLQLNVTQNGEYINWTLSSVGGSSSRYIIYDAYVEIDGNAVYGRNEQYCLSALSDSPDFPVVKGSTSGSVYIGSLAKEINVVFKGSVYLRTGVDYGGAFSFAATTVLRSRGILTREIPAMAQTKLFDFGNPTTKKSVPKAEMSFGANGGKPISVFIITDKGQTEDIVVPQGNSTDETEPKFFESVVIRNPAKLNNRIGYRLESSGNLFLDAISIHYKQLEGAK